MTFSQGMHCLTLGRPVAEKKKIIGNREGLDPRRTWLFRNFSQGRRHYQISALQAQQNDGKRTRGFMNASGRRFLERCATRTKHHQSVTIRGRGDVSIIQSRPGRGTSNTVGSRCLRHFYTSDIIKRTSLSFSLEVGRSPARFCSNAARSSLNAASMPETRRLSSASIASAWIERARVQCDSTSWAGTGNREEKVPRIETAKGEIAECTAQQG